LFVQPFSSEISIVVACNRPATEFVDFSAMQSELFHALDSYKDVHLPQWTLETANEIRDVYVIHALNHALKARAIVQKNDEKAKETEIEFQDQGFPLLD
jgi:U3 small nucleolar RNA-associated protein 25